MAVDLDRPPTAGSGDDGQHLRPASETAAREQRRQAARQNRTGVAGVVAGVPDRLRYLGSDEAARNGLRYQPVIWTVIALCAVAFFFPGRSGGPGTADLAVASPPPPAPTPIQQSPPTTSPTTAPPTTVRAAAPAPTVPRAPVTTSPPAAGSESPPATVAPTPSTTAPPPQPLSVRGFGWAATLGAFPTSSVSVPDGTMPVAKRLGTTDKVSFVRLAGTDSILVLTEDPEGANEPMGDATVKLCAIEEGQWEEEPGQDMSDAPTWSDTCTAGVEDDDTWTFDLSGLGDPARDAGFALVPGDSAPAEFQVTFLAS